MITAERRRSSYPDELSYSDKVEIFYRQTHDWQLNIADLVQAEIQHSGFAVVGICLNYLELVGMLEGDYFEGEAFLCGAERVLPELDEKARKILFRAGRCGLYHSGRTRKQILVSRLEEGMATKFDASSETLTIDPHQLPKKMKAHLEVLKQRLLDKEGEFLGNRFEDRLECGFAKPRRSRGSSSCSPPSTP